jgi:hypothetical protein
MCWRLTLSFVLAGKTEKAENGDTPDKGDTQADTSVKVKMET